MLTVNLPFPPSVNCLFAGKARRYPSPRYKRWKSAALWHLRMSKAKQILGPVDISIDLTAPDKRVRDVDNYSKALLDSLVWSGVLADDSQVQQLNLRWADGEPGARITIKKRKARRD